MNKHPALRFDGKRVLLTGAAGALGGALAQAYASLGADLILVDRPDVDWSRIQSLLSAETEARRVQIESCDLESEEARIALMQKVGNNGGLDVLVNNAAFVGTSALEGWATGFEAQSLQAWRRALEVNLTAAFHLTQLVYPAMKARPGANIVNIGSIYGALGPDWSLYEGTTMANPAAYAASKGGLVQLTRWLATTLGPDVRVNAVSPGGIFRAQAPEFVARYVQRTPLKRMATEADVVGAVCFLSSDWATYITGQHLLVDGGWSAW